MLILYYECGGRLKVWDDQVRQKISACSEKGVDGYELGDESVSATELQEA